MIAQSKVASLIEAVVNNVIGIVTAILMQMLIFPQFGIHISFQTNLWITFWFSLSSIVRSYVVRRWFNSRLHRAAESLSSHLMR